MTTLMSIKSIIKKSSAIKSYSASLSMSKIHYLYSYICDSVLHENERVMLSSSI